MCQLFRYRMRLLDAPARLPVYSPENRSCWNTALSLDHPLSGPVLSQARANVLCSRRRSRPSDLCRRCESATRPWCILTPYVSARFVWLWQCKHHSVQVATTTPLRLCRLPQPLHWPGGLSLAFGAQGASPVLRNGSGVSPVLRTRQRLRPHRRVGNWSMA